MPADLADKVRNQLGQGILGALPTKKQVQFSTFEEAPEMVSPHFQENAQHRMFKPRLAAEKPEHQGANELPEALRYGVIAPKRFQQFYLNDCLADFSLTDSDTGRRYETHRVVLAASSKLIKNFLSARDEALTKDVNKATVDYSMKMPRRYIRMRISEEENIILEQIVLRFIYDNQEFELIRPLITAERVASVLDLAMLLDCESLF